MFLQLAAILAPEALRRRMKTKLMLMALVLLISHFACAQQSSGSVCIAARADDPFWKEPATLPNGEINSHGLKFKIDKRSATELPQQKSLKIEELDTRERHLVVVLDSGSKPIQSV